MEYLQSSPILGLLGTPRPVPIRRVTGIQDKEGKTRMVAILDYWSQTALRPLHDRLFGILRVIPQDMTFSQGEFHERVRDWGGQGDGVFYSVDLSKATDRFPISLISFTLEGLFDSHFVHHWKNLMVGYPFSTVGGPVVYNCGNPMGAYSSWSAFAVAHHFVVYVACQRSGVKWSTARYVLLGDDILIGDSRVARQYLKILGILGVEASPSKTYVSKELCEFAKRLLYRGQEITPFPVSSVSDQWWSIPLVVSALRGEARKGYTTLSGIPSAVRALQEKVNPKSGRV
jgi:hypothetical protein